MEEQETSVSMATPFGELILSARGRLLTGIDLGTAFSGEVRDPPNPVLAAAVAQLSHYFEDPETRFSLPLRWGGTKHMRRVWAVLAEIPPGCTETYGSLARHLSSGPRAIAAACRANAFAIVIPCHRVIGAHGLGGYGGQTEGPMLEIKRWLLKHEGCPLD